MTETLKPFGRPTLYDPAYCDQVRELGALGKSIEQISSKLGVSIRTIYVWKDAYPDFLQAMEDAKIAEQNWWEEQGQLYMLEHKDGAKLNACLLYTSPSPRD